MACAWSCLAQPYFAAGPCGLSAIWWGRLKLRVSQSSRTTKAHGHSNWASTKLNWVSEQSGTTRDVPPATFTIQDIGAHASALALKEILCLFEISVVMLYCFMWLICKTTLHRSLFPLSFVSSHQRLCYGFKCDCQHHKHHTFNQNKSQFNLHLHRNAIYVLWKGALE